ncbi:hypothetical protein [Chryseobacterium indoltheticum]|uniref:DUF2946 domain-containing protein n=1 Tax=Chryseobacterium indoltheticum TaxID=254 RepID=A0A381FND0_9FLAO|nr:hypothetical protein [Chryseobacterium indoltheticum]AZA75442.1 hypothetical protein EG358_17515 [Chryseobacterium indoltheticum]QQQ27818.1 hypothetical protein JJL46_17300 [Chryseobacterium indoltheticum]SIQ67455.1 hypothetical protein SAMN05421682_10796 [Chryseobacterium indoltheticum]SUX48066.1 Uncharacterised protein [Chryseobacterium indoltheticum]SUY53550.1 Uncharacterised protein [Chryseobacterium indoltheticum]
MISKKGRQLKNFISKLMLGIYFFALFSSSFHSHESADFKHFNLKKTENSISKTDAKEKAGDCLACHFLATGNTLLPDEFSFTLIKHTHEVEQVFAVQEKIWSQTKFSFQLRGPPAIS